MLSTEQLEEEEAWEEAKFGAWIQGNRAHAEAVDVLEREQVAMGAGFTCTAGTGDCTATHCCSTADHVCYMKVIAAPLVGMHPHTPSKRNPCPSAQRLPHPTLPLPSLRCSTAGQVDEEGVLHSCWHVIDGAAEGGGGRGGCPIKGVARRKQTSRPGA